jgi:hypothetical protein
VIATRLFVTDDVVRLISPLLVSELIHCFNERGLRTRSAYCTAQNAYGRHSSIGRRDVAVAREETKLIVFQEVAKKIGKAVSGQWLPKAVMADRLLEIAEARGSFGLKPAGSIAFIAAARAAFAVIEDSDDENRRLLLQAKNNLGPKCKGLAFRMEQRLIPGDILSSNIYFESEHVTQSIDEALTASEGRGRGGQTSSSHQIRSALQVSAGHRAAKVPNAWRRRRQRCSPRSKERQLQARPLHQGGGCHAPMATRGYSYAPRPE